MPIPSDAQIAIDLASQLSTAEMPAEFTYDPFVIMENLPQDNRILVVPERLDWKRQARAIYTADSIITLIYIVEAEANVSDWTVMHNHLYAHDEMIKRIYTLRVGEKAQLPLAIETPERFNRAWFMDDSRLVIFSEITYAIIN